MTSQTFYDFDIPVEPGDSGEVRTLCPMCSHGRRKHSEKCLAVNVDEGVWRCWHCQWSGSLKGPNRAYEPIDTFDSHEFKADDPSARIEAARKLWRNAEPAAGTLVERYLATRGLTGPIPKSLRFLCDAFHGPSKTRRPCMIAAVRLWPRNRVVAIHRTFLRSDGKGKAPVEPVKMSLGPVGGGAVRLARADTVLAVAEGLESALAFHQVSSLPIWAALSASGLQAVILPPQAKEIFVAADHDEAGLDAAETLARRLHNEGRTVRIVPPETPGSDWADELKRNH
ncbi:MAG TPA: toprim domain-containing protein [Alphaproteobacteria bacterium]|nr:toprim domain-containing protein [Alphaproteobacteria bacterium]